MQVDRTQELPVVIPLEYNLSRSFPGRWFTPAVFVGAALAISALTVLNDT
jgi:hypothetical protein